MPVGLKDDLQVITKAANDPAYSKKNDSLSKPQKVRLKPFPPFCLKKKPKPNPHTTHVFRADIMGPKCTVAVTEQSSWEIGEGLLFVQ